MTARRVVVAILALAALAVQATALAQQTPQRRGFSVSITRPERNGLVFGRTRIIATVRAPDPRDIDRVVFTVNDRTVFVDKEPPWECTYDFGEESRSFVVRAIAWHREGFSVADTVVTRRIEISYVEEVNRVILWATVANKKGIPVSGLERKDFKVFEGGVEQEIAEFYPEDRPITLALLMDSSGSMRESLDEAHAAAGGFVEALGPEDRALVIDFDDKVYLLQDLTNDKRRLREAVESTEALGGTALYDALHAAYRKLAGIEGRKAIVLLSDGDDSASQFPLERVLEQAKAEGVLVYPIGLGGSVRKGVLKEFADATGGLAFFVNKASELAEVYQAIAQELCRQYYITFESHIETQDGRWIELRVETTGPDYKVRSRSGYFAVKREIDGPDVRAEDAGSRSP